MDFQCRRRRIGSIPRIRRLGTDVFIWPRGVFGFAAPIKGDTRITANWIALHQELARRHNKVIAAASFPVKVDNGYVNRVHVFEPTGLAGCQDKCIMTRFENEQWFISPGAKLQPIQTELGPLGIITCYDAEFPLLGHQLARAGCEITAPSCTDTQAGFNRVAISARARAMENQCYVLHSPTVGVADWSPAVDENIGRAGIYSPLIEAFLKTVF